MAMLAVANAILCSCMNATPQRPDGVPLGASVYCWSNDVLRNANGSIWVVNGTLTKDYNIVFQQSLLSPGEFRDRLASEGIPTHTAIRLVLPPGHPEYESESKRSSMSWDVMREFVEAGYGNFGYLSVPGKYWNYWTKHNWDPENQTARHEQAEE